MDPTEPRPAREPGNQRERTINVWIGIGVIALVGGVTLFLTSDKAASFGWFAYAPLSGEMYSPSGSLLTLQERAGLTIGAIGLGIVVFCAGWAIGRRRR